MVQTGVLTNVFISALTDLYTPMLTSANFASKWDLRVTFPTPKSDYTFPFGTLPRLTLPWEQNLSFGLALKAFPDQPHPSLQPLSCYTHETWRTFQFPNPAKLIHTSGLLHRLGLQPRMFSGPLDPYLATCQPNLFACSEKSLFFLPCSLQVGPIALSLASHRTRALVSVYCDFMFICIAHH